jgi:hypothetical protein
MKTRGSSLRQCERNWKLKIFDSETFKIIRTMGFFLNSENVQKLEPEVI